MGWVGIHRPEYYSSINTHICCLTHVLKIVRNLQRLIRNIYLIFFKKKSKLLEGRLRSITLKLSLKQPPNKMLYINPSVISEQYCQKIHRVSFQTLLFVILTCFMHFSLWQKLINFSWRDILLAGGGFKQVSFCFWNRVLAITPTTDYPSSLHRRHFWRKHSFIKFYFGH